MNPVGVTLQARENLCRNAKVFFYCMPNGSLLPGEGMAIKKTAQPHGCAFSFAWAVFGSHRNAVRPNPVYLNPISPL